MSRLLSILWIGTVLFWTPTVLAQPLAPVGSNVEEPLLPVSISDQNIEMFGELVYLWTEEHNTRVVHFIGDFELHMGGQRLRATEAIAWITDRQYKETTFHRFDIFLWRNAQVVEASGSAITGPALYVTLNSTGQIEVSADEKTHESSAALPVYVQAKPIWEVARSRQTKVEAESPISVIDLSRSEQAIREEVRPILYHYAKEKIYEEVDDRPYFLAIGEVLLFRGDPLGKDTVELRADAAVVYLATESDPTPDTLLEEARKRAKTQQEGMGAIREPVSNLAGESGFSLDGGVNDVDRVESAYLEGDVVLVWGDRTIRASQLYYDFSNNRALILDAVAFMPSPAAPDIPFYVRAEQIRQYSEREWAAINAKVTTDDFYVPHYHLGASRVEFTDLSPKTMSGSNMGPVAGAYRITDATFNLDGLPLSWWPAMSGEVQREIVPLKRIRTGYSDNRGVELEATWDLFSLASIQAPPGFDVRLLTDYFSERGPALGLEADYASENYFGLFRGYGIYDDGEDNLGRYADNNPPHKTRGRLTFRHRQYLANDWQLTLEGSYISDRNFLEEYFENEYDNDKKQETLLYLKKQRDNWALTGLVNFHILDFITETEHLPEATFRLIGQDLGGVSTLFSENRVGMVRYRAADQTFKQSLFVSPQMDSSRNVFRADSRQELEFPFSLGPVRIVPFGAIRGTVWDGSIDNGGIGRTFGTVGVRSSMHFWKDYNDIYSELFDINGIRHIIKADAVAWTSFSDTASREQYNFDESVEKIDDFDGVELGLRQRWQTRRGEGENARVTDVFLFDLEMGLFNDVPSRRDSADIPERHKKRFAPLTVHPKYGYTDGYVSFSRPELSIPHNYVNGRFQWRLSDTTAVMSETNFDLNSKEVDIFNLSLAVERSPRLSYLVGYRYINEIDSNLLGAGANYKINEKYTVAVREQFDLDRGKTEEFTIAIIRKFPKWYVGVEFELDEIREDVSVSITAWPEGLPQATLGTRRYTGLATSTAIRTE